MFGSFHFSFFVLVDEVTKNENRLCDFLYDVFRLQGKTGKTKMKNNKQTNKLFRNIFVFHNFCQPKRKTKNGMKSSIGCTMNGKLYRLHMIGDDYTKEGCNRGQGFA